MYIYIHLIDSQIVHHNPCFNLFILHNNSYDYEGSEINKNDIFLCFDIRGWNFWKIVKSHIGGGLSIEGVFKSSGHYEISAYYLFGNADLRPYNTSEIELFQGIVSRVELLR